jgi:hypothetical protein
METLILPFEQWPLVEPVVRGEFRNAMPQTPHQASFLTALDGDRLAGFVHVETVFNLNSVYVAPEYRGAGRRSGLLWQLITETDALLTSKCQGFSAIAMPEARSHMKMYKLFGGRSLGLHEVWRKDF